MNERGAVLLEFALVLLLLYVVLFGALELGRAILGAQVVQDAARVAARELALASLPPDATFEDALQDPFVQRHVYDDDFLVIDLGQVEDLDSFFESLPIVNQMLRPLMFVDAGDSGSGRKLLRYPGALLADPTKKSGFTVQIPRVVARDDDGVETIEWVEVLEEIRADGEDQGPFSTAAASPLRGVVALRVNYPYQAAALSGFRTDEVDPDGANLGNPILAADGSVTELNHPVGGASLVHDSAPAGVYAGPYGLGRQQALLKTLRPFRKLISAQAVFRREVFAHPKEHEREQEVTNP